MKSKLYFSAPVIFRFNCIQEASASVIDDHGPNSLVIGKAFGLMLFGIAFLGLTVGPQNDIKIQLPNYMTKERYDRAFLDLKNNAQEAKAVTKYILALIHKQTSKQQIQFLVMFNPFLHGAITYH